MRAFFLAPVLLAAATALHAQAGVAIDSAVYIERDKPSPDGMRRVVEPAELLRRGDRVVTVLRWNAPRHGSYTVTSAVPATLDYEKSSSEAVEVSTDGGRTWRAAESAQPERVTHLRWRVGSGEGRLSYSAIVR